MDISQFPPYNHAPYPCRPVVLSSARASDCTHRLWQFVTYGNTAYITRTPKQNRAVPATIPPGDTKQQTLELLRQGITQSQIAKSLNVSRSRINTYTKELADANLVKPYRPPQELYRARNIKVPPQVHYSIKPRGFGAAAYDKSHTLPVVLHLNGETLLIEHITHDTMTFAEDGRLHLFSISCEGARVEWGISEVSTRAEPRSINPASWLPIAT
jgi:hypothetical protein